MFLDNILSFYILQETAEFSIHFDKVYLWSASNVQERLLLFSILWKLCTKYLPKQSPMFVNIPPGIIEDSVIPETSVVLDHEGIQLKLVRHFISSLSVSFKIVSGQMDGGIGEEDYQALTEREEKDLERLLSQSNNALSNAEKFMEQLAKDLSLLDGVYFETEIYHLKYHN